MYEEDGASEEGSTSSDGDGGGDSAGARASGRKQSSKRRSSAGPSRGRKQPASRALEDGFSEDSESSSEGGTPMGRKSSSRGAGKAARSSARGSRARLGSSRRDTAGARSSRGTPSKTPRAPRPAKSVRDAWFRAVRGGRTGKVLQLLKQHPGLRETEEKRTKDTALLLACRLGAVDMVEALVKQRAKYDPHPLHGHSAVHAAAACGRAECLAALLETASASGAAGRLVDSMCLDDFGCAALHMACSLGDEECVRVLLQFEASWKRANDLGRTALHALSGGCERSTRVGMPDCWRGEEETSRGSVAARRLLELEAAGVAPSGSSAVRSMAARIPAEGMPPLSRRPARYSECLEAIWKHTLAEAIAESGVEMQPGGSDMSQSHRTELAAAVALGRDTIRKELARGDAFGRTPLHWAAARGMQGLVELMLRMKAPVMLLDAGGRLPSAMAREQGHSAIERLLASAERAAAAEGDRHSYASIWS